MIGKKKRLNKDKGLEGNKLACYAFSDIGPIMVLRVLIESVRNLNA